MDEAMRPSDLGSVPTSMRCHVREYARLVYGDVVLIFNVQSSSVGKRADVPFLWSVTS
jgi:hypothetical protein